MREIYFHEDDYCQLELTPKSNWSFCAKQMGEIVKFAEAHKAGMGWTAMYARSENPIPLSSLNITKSELAACMPPSMPAFDKVIYAGDGMACEKTIAFGPHSSLAVFAEFDDGGLVGAAWFTFDVSTEKDVVVAMELSKALSKWPLLIADWGWSILLPADDTEALQGYFMERFKVFGKAGETPQTAQEVRQETTHEKMIRPPFWRTLCQRWLGR